MPKAPKKLIAAIAKKSLHFDTLETRNSDRLDFREVSVWGVEQALAEAYAAGTRVCKASKRKKKG